MATRSSIGIVNSDGNSITAIYCHWDGYPEHNGKLLLNHYKDRGVVDELMNLGDLSMLAERVNPSGLHTFDKPEHKVCIAYGRDRGENEDTDSKYFNTLDEYEQWAENCYCECQYLYDTDGVWKYRNRDTLWVTLTPEVCGENDAVVE